MDPKFPNADYVVNHLLKSLLSGELRLISIPLFFLTFNKNSLKISQGVHARVGFPKGHNSF